MPERSVGPPFDVLLVEDNPDDVRLVEWAFSNMGGPDTHSQSSRQYPTAASARLAIDNLSSVTRLSTAIAHATTTSPDVVLLDLDLPDSRGLETLDSFVSQTSPLPIIVLTGRDENELGIEAIQRGAQEYLYKGDISHTVLARAIQYAVERHEIRHRLFDATNRLRLTNEIVRRQLRNDISVVIGQVDQLADTDQHSDRTIEEILAAARDIDATIDIAAEFTDTALPDEGTEAKRDLGMLIAAAVDRVEQTTGVSITRSVDSTAVGDMYPALFQTILMYLLYDAVDRADPADSVSITAKAVAEGVQLTITNVGAELPPEHQDLLSTATDSGSGSPGDNIGLRLVSLIGPKYEVDITVEENIPSGSRVILSIDR